MTEKSIIANYSKKYDLWHRQQDVKPQQLSVWYQWVQSILEADDIDNGIVLEIGCGRGVFAAYLCEIARPPQRYYGCDYSIGAINIAKEKYKQYNNAIWQCEDIQSLSFPDNFFDTIISCETIEHIPNPNMGLSELYRVLKPGGKLILTCPNYFNLFGIWCLYRKIIGKPFTEGGQPYVNYILAPFIYAKLLALGFRIKHFHSKELIIPSRIPKTFYWTGTPQWLTFFGSRTFYVLIK